MEGTIAGRINALVDAALNQKPHATDEEITVAIMENPELVWDAAKVRISEQVRKRRTAKRHRPQNPYQTFFEGYGFQDLSEIVTIKAGAGELRMERRRMGKIDIRDWVRSLEISAENKPKLNAARKLLEDFTAYERKYRGLNLERYFDLLAAGVPKPEMVLSKSERSEKIRQQWAALTPAERRAIHEKRLKTRAANLAKAETK
jgi:hypothetical protein